MTYQEHFEKLRKKFGEASQALMNADNKLSIQNGWLNKKIIDDFVKAKIEWQDAANQYNTFLDFARQTGFNPSDTMYEG